MEINLLTFPPLIEAGFVEDFRQCVETGTIVVSERQYRSKWGKEIHCRLNLAPIRDASDEVSGTQVILEDITEQRHAEATLGLLDRTRTAMGLRKDIYGDS